MGHKKSLKAKLALVGVILLVVLASFSFWTHRDDVFHGFDAGFEQSKQKLNKGSALSGYPCFQFVSTLIYGAISDKKVHF